MKQSRFNIWTEHNGQVAVYNGASGALLRITPDQHQAFQSFIVEGVYNECLDGILEQFARGRIILPDDADELALLEHRYQTTRNDSSLFQLTIVPSLGCNFDCPYCFESKHPSILSDDVNALLLRVVEDQLEKGAMRIHVTWFGGEPLLGKKALLALSDGFIERCAEHSAKYDANIVTNGFLLDEATCRALRDRRVTAAQVGLDGPPDLHNLLRPLRGGRGSFERIVENLHHAVQYMNVSVRVNVDSSSVNRVEELFQRLAAEGFAGSLTVYPGQIVGITDYANAPSATYTGKCLNNQEFAHVERDFLFLASKYGLASPSMPTPTGAPCTAVRKNELVVGSEGELYKCWNNVGNPTEIVGHIRDYEDLNGRLNKWLNYDPFENPECRSCIALPVCMGGCAHHAMSPTQYENRCGTFRHTYREQIIQYLETAERSDRNTTVLIPARQLFRRIETR